MMETYIYETSGCWKQMHRNAHISMVQLWMYEHMHKLWNWSVFLVRLCTRCNVLIWVQCSHITVNSAFLNFLWPAICLRHNPYLKYEMHETCRCCSVSLSLSDYTTITVIHVSCFCTKYIYLWWLVKDVHGCKSHCTCLYHSIL